MISIRDVRAEIGKFVGTKFSFSSSKAVTAVHKFKWGLKKIERRDIDDIIYYIFIFRAFDIHSRSNILNRRDEALETVIRHRTIFISFER